MDNISVYPTGDEVIDSLCEFITERLEKPQEPYNGKPCLAEDWWVADRVKEGRYFPRKKLSQEEGLRFCWRYVRDKASIKFYSELIWEEPNPDLLLHQVTELMPTLFNKAKEIKEQQDANLS